MYCGMSEFVGSEDYLLCERDRTASLGGYLATVGFELSCELGKLQCLWTVPSDDRGLVKHFRAWKNTSLESQGGQLQ